jgi:hypothetical protein
MGAWLGKLLDKAGLRNRHDTVVTGEPLLATTSRSAKLRMVHSPWLPTAIAVLWTVYDWEHGASVDVHL